MRILFICSRNRLRSPTAEAIFACHSGVEALSAGTAPDAETTVSADLIAWADLVVAMESVHRKRLIASFPCEMKTKKIVTLGIRDRYGYMQLELVELLRRRMLPFLPEATPSFLPG